jgi:hypothetical protein
MLDVSYLSLSDGPMSVITEYDTQRHKSTLFSLILVRIPQSRTHRGQRKQNNTLLERGFGFPLSQCRPSQILIYAFSFPGFDLHPKSHEGPYLPIPTVTTVHAGGLYHACLT